MTRFLLLYSTTDGHTRHIAEFMAKHWQAAEHDVSVQDVSLPLRYDLAAFDWVVLGASVRGGRHQVFASDFAAANLEQLQRMKSAFFSVNLQARTPPKDTPEGNPHLQQFLQSTPWRPDHVGVFAGKLNMQRYRWKDRLMAMSAMWASGEHVWPWSVREYTDWAAVTAFADALLAQS
ncbi:menaquinone-dependent protoporphyrinogen IX dehydrogenase [Atopomonas sediminilitoris]|uniref:menaquinone-dependent protoporphyrinogen IX dehydrogenase n=1 Tax=Atopomonas sediminilitoris TaxID=2919919 RepID=UPI001F4D4BED|nr:menaquinone-dependent protoporphyrinogen IX dehydrogenase [Atopomonas sediminilitoris]MCJ8169798.1 menaquinone-dependent protoporphyrinogen IX dehydrogenase [Atopomonas sediminilitoris]